jgi:hypothetical protein
LKVRAAGAAGQLAGGPIFVNWIGDGGSALMKEGLANACPNSDRE